jgi:glucose/arabinose dehydrogenase
MNARRSLVRVRGVAALCAVVVLASAGCAAPREPVVVRPPVATTTAVPTSTPPPTVPLSRVGIGFELVADGFDQPLFVTGAGDGKRRLFVVEKTGRIWVLQDGKRTTQPFLDLSDAVSTVSEQGLLGLVFSRSFASDGLFYVDYTDLQGNTVISRFHAVGTRADRASEEVLLQIAQPYKNHNGGMLAFGPDGYLYVAMGDGGSGGDPYGNGQNLGALLGKILRIDVSSGGSPASGTPYGIPAGNPFVGRAGALPEIWAYGLRNPWRFSFDRVTGDLWIGDNGQELWEEIDWQSGRSAGGENYAWNLYEGTHPYPPGSQPRSGDYVMPVIEYDHTVGDAVIGGYVYRGKKHPSLVGTYFYGDYGSGRVWGARKTGARIENRELARTSFTISSFGEDDAGELYVADLRGAIHRVVAR